MSRDQRNPLVYMQCSKKKETMNKILARVSTKDSCKRLFVKVQFWLISHYSTFAKSRD